MLKNIKIINKDRLPFVGFVAPSYCARGMVVSISGGFRASCSRRPTGLVPGDPTYEQIEQLGL